MSRVAFALASGLQLGTSLSTDDANSLVQLPTAAHDVGFEAEADIPVNCDPLPHDFVDWTLCGKPFVSTMKEPGSSPTDGQHNPDDHGYLMSEGSLTFSQVVVDGHETLDMVVTQSGDWECFNPSDNGKRNNDPNNCFGQLNVMTGTSAVFDFAFKKANGDPHTVKNFMFSFYDVDQQSDSDREYVELVTPPVRYWTSNDTESNNAAQVIKDADTWRFESRGAGRGSSDNPSTYEKLFNSPNQRSKMVTVQYANLANFKIRFGHTTRGESGRKILFSGRVPNLVCPPPNPTTTPAPVCPDFREATMNWKMCADTNRPKLPKSNNLGGVGPYTENRSELRYDNVTRYGGRELDLVVVNATTYTPYRLNRSSHHDEWRNDAGTSGCFGVINVKHNTSVDLDFKFVYNGQNDGPTFDANDKFVFSVWDIDHSMEPGSLERITIQHGHVGEMSIGPNVDKVTNAQGDIVLTSKVFGKGSDNPQDDLVAGMDGAAKRAAMVLSGTNTWRVTLEAGAGAGGRNFMFYGCRSEQPAHPVS